MSPEARVAYRAGDFTREVSASQEPTPAGGTSELVLYVKMGLVFRLEVQVGATVLVENPSGRVADDGILGFVHCGEDVIQRFQLLRGEAGLGEKSPRNTGGGDEEIVLGYGLPSPPYSPHNPSAREKIPKPNHG